MHGREEEYAPATLALVVMFVGRYGLRGGITDAKRKTAIAENIPARRGTTWLNPSLSLTLSAGALSFCDPITPPLQNLGSSAATLRENFGQGYGTEISRGTPGREHSPAGEEQWQPVISHLKMEVRSLGARDYIPMRPMSPKVDPQT